jgi:hypothetical protein
MERLVAALAALLMLGACDSSQQPAARVIPWVPLAPNLTPPSPSVAPVVLPPGTPPCQATGLVGAVIGSNGATGHALTSFAFAGVGPASCYLEGAPAVGLVDGSGQAIAFKQRPPFMPSQQPGPALVDPGPPPTPNTAVKIGEAGLVIDWATQPEVCPGGTPVVPAEALIAIPGGGILSVTIPAGPPAYVCQGLGVGDFEGPYLPVQASPPPQLPAISLELPHSVRVGQPLEYLMTLTETRAQPLDLVALCPTYDEELYADIVNGSPPLGGKHVYSLNCAPAGTLKPGASATFRLVLKVPTDAAPGTYTFAFGLGYWNAMTRVLQTSVAITK